MAQEAFVFTVETHEHRERSADWYWALGLGALLGAGISIFFGNVLLAIILVIGAASIGFLAARGPREHQVRIDSRGIAVDGTLYPYRTLQSFWIDDGGEWEHLPAGREPRLYITTGSFLAPRFTIPLQSPAQAGQVRAYLRTRAHEEEQHPHFGEQVAELLGL